MASFRANDHGARFSKVPKCFRTGARYSEVPKTFRVWEAIFNCPSFKNKEVYRHETLHEGEICSY